MRDLLMVWSGSAVLMVALWLVQRRRQDASLVDAGWSAAIGVAGVILAWVGPGDPVRRSVVALLVACWSIRLTSHLVQDRLVGKPEDGRYKMLRSTWGVHAQRNFFWFFQAQALLIAIFAAPAWVISGGVYPFGTWNDVAGIVVWAMGIGIEAAADRELARWRADPAHHGRTCRAGWWRISRHPNYFGEWLLWCGYGLLALGSAHAWVAVCVPFLLLALLLGVTGIPYTERRALASRGDDYRSYQRATSPFIPWFPRQETS